MEMEELNIHTQIIQKKYFVCVYRKVDKYNLETCIERNQMSFLTIEKTT